MSRVLVARDPHVPGRHCASSALRDVAHHAGHRISEPLCFGLGAGVGFVYVEAGFLSPTRLFHCRSPDLEGAFFRRLGIDFQWQTAPDAHAGWEQTRRLILEGLPVLVQTDLRYLPYYRSRTHFTGHVIGVWGHDDEERVAYVADTHFPGLQVIPLAALAAARTSQAPPCPLASNYFPGALPQALPPLAPLVRAALRDQAETMLVPLDENQSLASGVAGMRLLAASFPTWSQAADASWCARFAYQVIERRGTGGGGFRRLYRDFLEEAETLCPELRGAGFPTEMGEIASAWTELALHLRKVSEKPDHTGFMGAAERIASIALGEERFWRALLAAVGSGRPGTSAGPAPDRPGRTLTGGEFRAS